MTRPPTRALLLLWCAAAAVLSAVAGTTPGPAAAAEPARPTLPIPPWPAGPFVILRGGDVIAGRLQTLTTKQVTVDSASFGRLVLPRSCLLGYRSSPRIGPPETNSGDLPVRLTLANDDRLEAAAVAVESALLSLRGVAGLAIAERPVALPLVRVLAIDLAAVDALEAGGSQSDTAMNRWVALEDGSRLRCRDFDSGVVIHGEGLVSLRPLTAGLPAVLRCPANEIAVIEPGRPGLRLAEAGPVGSVVPAGWPIRCGRTLTGGWPRLRGQTGFTAIGLHAPATVGYRFDRPVVRFTATVGIADSAGQGGSVVVCVAAGAADQPPVEVFRSPVLRGGDSPLPIDLPLAAATSLELVVEPADGGSVLDRSLWLDPRVWHEPAESRE